MSAQELSKIRKQADSTVSGLLARIAAPNQAR